MIRLETPRLLLRSFKPDDAAALYELDHDPLVAKFLGPYALNDVAAYRERIVTSYARYADRADGLGLWAVVEKSAGEFLGWACLRPAGDYRFAAEAGFTADDAELGYRLRSAAWNRGYATEASRGLISDAFHRDSTPRVVATALASNAASLRVMEKCGLRRRGEFQLAGFDATSLVYRLARQEFFA